MKNIVVAILVLTFAALVPISASAGGDANRDALWIIRKADKAQTIGADGTQQFAGTGYYRQFDNNRGGTFFPNEQNTSWAGFISPRG